MLDGERSFANSESRHFFIDTHTRVYGTQPWRVRSLTADIDLKRSLSAPSYFVLTQYF